MVARPKVVIPRPAHCLETKILQLTTVFLEFLHDQQDLRRFEQDALHTVEALEKDSHFFLRRRCRRCVACIYLCSVATASLASGLTLSATARTPLVSPPPATNTTVFPCHSRDAACPSISGGMRTLWRDSQVLEPTSTRSPLDIFR